MIVDCSNTDVRFIFRNQHPDVCHVAWRDRSGQTDGLYTVAFQVSAAARGRKGTVVLPDIDCNRYGLISAYLSHS